MLESLDRCRRDSTLFQFTSRPLRDFTDPNHLLIQIDEQLDFAKLAAPLEERLRSAVAVQHECPSRRSAEMSPRRRWRLRQDGCCLGPPEPECWLVTPWGLRFDRMIAASWRPVTDAAPILMAPALLDSETSRCSLGVPGYWIPARATGKVFPTDCPVLGSQRTGFLRTVGLQPPLPLVSGDEPS